MTTTTAAALHTTTTSATAHTTTTAAIAQTTTAAAFHTSTTAAGAQITTTTTTSESGSYLVGYVPLLGSNGCDCTAPVVIGGQTFNLIIDSGSSNFAVAASTCTNCNSISPEYSGALTSNSVTLRYGSGSFTGTITDALSFTFGGLSASMEVIAITSQTTFFTCSNAAQGIMGIAYSPLSQG